MFSKPLDKVELSDIEAFCREFPEGVRVEYKSETPTGNKIPKILSSFANTHGGILIIGVETNERNEGRVPLKGIPTESGIEERIVQSAYDGIYPPIIPEVKIAQAETGNAVVIVRVGESAEAPHAINNSTKVYVRVGSTAQPHFKIQLANVDRIDFMLRKRERSQEVSDRIVKASEKRVIERWKEPYIDLKKTYPGSCPNITLISRPVFPYRPIIAVSEIYSYLRENQNSPKYQRFEFDENVQEFGTKRIPGGVCYLDETWRNLNYQELNEYGVIYWREEWKRIALGGDATYAYLTVEKLLRMTCAYLQSAAHFYQHCEYLGDIEITARIRQVRGSNLRFEDGMLQLGQAYDPGISASIRRFARELNDNGKAENAVMQLAEGLLWIFNVRLDAWKNAARNFIKLWHDKFAK